MYEVFSNICMSYLLELAFLMIKIYITITQY
jgi:hypothetical protein